MPITDYTGARKESTGYSHIVTLKWNNVSVDWDTRVRRWPNLRRSISTSENAFIGGGDNISFLDTDQVLWGSFYGANGTQPLWSSMEINSSLGGPDGTFAFPTGTDTAKFGLFRFGQARFGDLLFSGMITKGRTLELVSTNDDIQFSMHDDIELLDKAKFVWDYSNLSTDDGAAIYGTVHSVINATTVVLEDSVNRELRGTLSNIFLPTSQKTYPTQWQQLSNFGAVGTDVIFPGDTLKFSDTNIDDDDAGSVLLENQGFIVNSGSFYVSSGVGTFGTIELGRKLFDVRAGDYVYKQKALVYEGNPAQIVKDMITGANTTVNLPAGSVSGTHFYAATAACGPMIFKKFIDDDSEGAVLREIQSIGEPLEADFFFNRSGKWIWLPFRPRMRDNIDIQADFYDAIDGGTDNIIGNVRHVQRIEDVAARVNMKFAFDTFEADRRLQFTGFEEATNVAVSDNYNGWPGFKKFESMWVHDANDARVIVNRVLRNHGTAHVNFEFTTSLYGLEEDLYRLLVLTHRTGSMTDKAFSLNDINMNLQDNKISLGARDITRGYFESGYGYILDGSAQGVNVVSGTSTWGYTWPQSEGGAKHGTLMGRVAVSADAATYTLRDTGGAVPSIGLGGITCYISIGSEIYKSTDAGNVGNPSGTFHFDRHQETTGSHKDGTADDGFTMWPVNNQTDYDIVPYGGTIIGGVSAYDRCDGTAHEISTGTYGTLFRLF